MNKTSEMNKTWLIQRLLKPTGVENPFSFGGGQIRGGFSKEIYPKLMKVFDFDYMGSAEFEYGDVPKAFGRMFEAREEFVNFPLYVGKDPVYIRLRS